MTYCTWDNLLLYLCLNGCILKVSSSRDGWGLLVMCFFVLSLLPGGRGGGLWGGAGGYRGKLSQLVYTKSVFIEGVDRTGSVLFETGTFFCTKVIIKAQLLLIQGHYGWMISELKRIYFVLFSFKDKETVSSFAWLSVVFLLACVPGKSMTIVWTLTYRCVWNC